MCISIFELCSDIISLSSIIIFITQIILIKMMCTDTFPGHCAAAGHNSLQCSHFAASGGRGSSQWWAAGRLVWSRISSPPQLCSKSSVLSGVQTAAGLQAHPRHHTHKTHSKDKCMYPQWSGTCVWNVEGKHSGMVRKERSEMKMKAWI